MDTTSYDQYEVGKDVVGDTSDYLVDQTDCELVFYRDKPIMVEMPTTVDLIVSETPPGYKGDTASGGGKPATLGDRHPRHRAHVHRHRRQGARGHPLRRVRHPGERLTSSGIRPASTPCRSTASARSPSTSGLYSIATCNLSNVWITGEVSNLFASGVGHRYFTLKNAEHQLKAVHFSGYYGGEHVVNGAQVMAHGRVSFYSNRGETQLYADSVVPAGKGR